MKVTVIRIWQFDGATRAELQSDCGRLTAEWASTGAPEPGAERFIELSVDGVLSLGVDFLETAEVLGVFTNRDRTSFVGEVTYAADDGFVKLNFGCGAIDLEVDGDVVVGRRYRFEARVVRAYDCNY